MPITPLRIETSRRSGPRVRVGLGFAGLNVYLLLAALWLPASARAENWIFAADAWCPYNCAPKSAAPGYMVEIVERAARTAGHTATYELMPWSRALAAARVGKISGVYGVTGNDRKDILLSAQMGVDSTCFFVKKGGPFLYRDVSDLARLTSVGTTQDYVYADEFMQWQRGHGDKIQVVAGGNSIEMNANKVNSRRIDAFVENAAVVESARGTIAALKGIVSAGCMQGKPMHVGVSAKVAGAAEIIKAINTTLAQMQRQGELAPLLARYGVEPWLDPALPVTR